MDRSLTYWKRLNAVCGKQHTRTGHTSVLIPGAVMDTPQPTGDLLARWLYERFDASRVRRPTHWENLASDERSHWRFEAKAVLDKVAEMTTRDTPQ